MSIRASEQEDKLRTIRKMENGDNVGHERK